MTPNPQAVGLDPEFPYGWRYVKRTTPDGREEFDQIPLSLEDVLHPQEGDVIPANTDHDADCHYLASVFRDRPLSPDAAFVTHDCLVDWGVPGLRDHSPDLAVFVGLSADPRPTGLVRLKRYDGRCELALEVVSPHTRSNDVDTKVGHYLRAGVPLYVIVDQRKENGPRSLLAYRKDEANYERVEPDESGRIAVPVLGLSIGLHENHPLCFDLRTGEELGDYSSVVRQREEAKRERDEANRERDEAKQAREKVEEAMGVEVEARYAAQRQTREAKQESEKQQALAEERRLEIEKQQALAEEHRLQRDRAQKEADKQRELAEERRLESERAQKEADKQREEADKQRARAEQLADQQKRAEDAAAQRIRDLEAMLRQFQTVAPPADPAG